MTQYKALVGLEESIQEDVAALLPRQAIAVAPEGNSVWVRFVGEATTAPPTQLPTTVAGVPAGTTGWVYPVAGGKGLFIQAGAVVPISFSGDIGGTLQSTTTIGATYTYISCGSVAAPAGTYEVTGIFMANVKRSVNTGEVWIRARVGGTDLTSEAGTGAATIGAANTWFTLNGKIAPMNVVHTGGALSFEIGYQGKATAGTTSMYRGSIFVTARRIG